MELVRSDQPPNNEKEKRVDVVATNQTQRPTCLAEILPDGQQRIYRELMAFWMGLHDVCLFGHFATATESWIDRCLQRSALTPHRSTNWVTRVRLPISITELCRDYCPPRSFDALPRACERIQQSSWTFGCGSSLHTKNVSSTTTTCELHGVPSSFSTHICYTFTIRLWS